MIQQSVPKHAMFDFVFVYINKAQEIHDSYIKTFKRSIKQIQINNRSVYPINNFFPTIIT